jgi:outer membrane lipoprotein SlyB
VVEDKDKNEEVTDKNIRNAMIGGAGLLGGVGAAIGAGKGNRLRAAGGSLAGGLGGQVVGGGIG